MKGPVHYCEVCEKEILLGKDYFMTSLTGDKVYCSEECLKKDLKANHVDEVLDEWLEDSIEYYTEEEEDPYDRYGVSRGDF